MVAPAVSIESFRARVQAFAASEDLEGLIKSDDPEVRQRARKALKEVESENTPPVEGEDNTPQERAKFNPQTQPRDAQGKFRQVLARLKQNLGTSGNQGVMDKIREAENLDNVGDYAGAVSASSELIGLVDRLDSGALNARSAENIRASTTELGKVIANLPLPFDNQAQKIRYSDLPAALKDLLDSLISRVEMKIGKKDADIATQDLRGFMSGSDFYSQSEVSSQMNRMLRLLT